MTKIPVNHGIMTIMTTFPETFLKIKIKSKGFRFYHHFRHVIMRYRIFIYRYAPGIQNIPRRR